MSEEPVYAIAGSYQEAINWFHLQNISPARQRYVQDKHQLMGLHGITIHRVGTWRCNPAYDEDFQGVMRMAEMPA